MSIYPPKCVGIMMLRLVHLLFLINSQPREITGGYDEGSKTLKKILIYLFLKLISKSSRVRFEGFYEREGNISLIKR